MASKTPHFALDEYALARDHGDVDGVDLEEVDWIFDENMESAFGNLNQTPCDAATETEFLHLFHNWAAQKKAIAQIISVVPTIIDEHESPSQTHPQRPVASQLWA
ncbi:hypothetical protein CASFOL_004991 [Castilleja foliolosa]|uniref:Uncharacterized protein n=1 Tax=Castilleja foliolosa TaxID=1961234 RepID=A0ABD3E2I3_9LAMI